MKEVIFRGKTKDGKWVKGFYCKQYNSEPPYARDGIMHERLDGMVAYSTTEVARETIGQYIGLCDRNGTQIFVGDIVSHRDEHAVIAYDEEKARFCLSFDTWSTDFDHLYGKDVEVIGNTYDNPELREGES